MLYLSSVRPEADFLVSIAGLDVLAHSSLWEIGLDYRHGIGQTFSSRDIQNGLKNSSLLATQELVMELALVLMFMRGPKA